MSLTPFTRTLLGTAAALSLFSTTISAETFSWAGTTDPQTMDPHAIKLRSGVTFHNGAAFTAEDVMFSYERAASEESDVRSWFAPVKSVNVVDELTIDFMTNAPNPLFPDSIANFMIMDSEWTTSNEATRPSKDAENHATRNTNGTGAFMVSSRDPGVKTTLKPFADWWDTMESNITEALFTPIGQSATGMAALLSGEIDFISPIPLQDVPRMKERAGFTVHEGVEARVLMFGFAHQADALKFSDDVTGKNPFQDVRVRQAAYQAVNVDALIDKIMRGNAQPASQLVSDAMKGYSVANADRLDYDPDAAKQLMADAGYADGFSFGLQCPNDRYINDEAICKAAASMFAKVGLNAKLTSMPVRNYWPELREDKFDMYLLGWSELDDSKRQAMIDETTAIMQEEVAYIPMYVQPLIWASKDNIELTQRTDNFFILRWVTVN